MSSPLPAKRRLTTLPLLRRESIGGLYHVLTFEDTEGASALPGQFVMVRGAEWGDAPLLPRPMSYLTGGNTPSILIKVIGEGTLRMGRAEPGERSPGIVDARDMAFARRVDASRTCSLRGQVLAIGGGERLRTR